MSGAALLQQAERPGLAASLPPLACSPAWWMKKARLSDCPRINAAGRLDTGSIGVKLLLAGDAAAAEPLAQELNCLNILRKELGTRILEDIEVEDQAVIAYNPDWHQGVIGIAAGQISSRYQVPAILMTAGGDGNIVGSCRSPEGIDIYKVLTACSEHLLKFGGHPAAAGFSLTGEKLESFCQAARQAIAREMEGWTRPELAADLVVQAGDITPDLVAELSALAPCGEGNPRPLLFCRGLAVKSIDLPGRETSLPWETAGAACRRFLGGGLPRSLGAALAGSLLLPRIITGRSR